MRRSASEIIRSLEMRIARLEAKKASHNTVYTVANNEVNAINQLGKKMKPKDLELVLLNALSHNLNKHREALILSKGLGLTSNNLWLGDKRIARISNILVANYVVSVESLGKVFAQYCRDFAPKKERTVLRMLKTIGVSLREYSLNSTQDLFDLIYQKEVDLSNPADLFYIENYKGISYNEEENYDPDDGGFSYEYGSERGYYSYGRNTMVDVDAEGKGYLTISLDTLPASNPIKVHPDFDFIANLIDMNEFEALGGNEQESYEMEDYTGDNWPDDGLYAMDIETESGASLYISRLVWGRGSFDSDGNLKFYVSWDAVGQYEYEDDGGY